MRLQSAPAIAPTTRMRTMATTGGSPWNVKPTQAPKKEPKKRDPSPAMLKNPARNVMIVPADMIARGMNIAMIVPMPYGGVLQPDANSWTYAVSGFWPIRTMMTAPIASATSTAITGCTALRRRPLRSPRRIADVLPGPSRSPLPRSGGGA